MSRVNSSRPISRTSLDAFLDELEHEFLGDNFLAEALLLQELKSSQGGARVTVQDQLPCAKKRLMTKAGIK
jgi:hypothetical protein